MFSIDANTNHKKELLIKNSQRELVIFEWGHLCITNIAMADDNNNKMKNTHNIMCLKEAAITKWPAPAII